MALIIPVFISFVVIYILSFYKKIRNHLIFNYYGTKIPGPPLKPIMGNTYLFRNRPNEKFQIVFREEARKARERGDTVIRYLLPGKLIVWPLTGKSLAQLVESTTEIHKGSDYSMFEPWFNGLLLLVGDRWKSHRKMISPTFHFAKLEGYFNVFNSESKILTECVEKFADSGETVDIFPYINRCLLDIICKTAMRTKVDAQFNHDHPYLKAVKGYATLMLKHSMTPVMWNSFLFWALGYKKQQDDYLFVLKKFTGDVIAERKASLKSGEAEASSTKRKMNFLDMMLSMTESNQLSEEDLRNEVDTFMFGGHDTTTTSSSWTVWCLAHHPEIQQKVYEEIVNVCGEDTNTIVTYEQVSTISL